MISIGKLKEMLPEKTYLTYVDREDNLNDYAAKLVECLRANNYDTFWDEEMTWFTDQRCSQTDYYMQELVDPICEELKKCGGQFADSEEAREEEAMRLLDVWEEELTDAINERDVSDPFGELVQNTKPFTMTYDTGLVIDPNEPLNRNVWRIKARLKIKGHEYDAKLREMVQNAYHGGQLLIFFYDKVGKPYISDELAPHDYVVIQFDDFHLGIVDYCNGSGDSVWLEGATISMPFNREKLDIDLAHPSNFSVRVCDMVKDWAKETKVTLI
jgi:hypothetical protein